VAEHARALVEFGEDLVDGQDVVVAFHFDAGDEHVASALAHAGWISWRQRLADGAGEAALGRGDVAASLEVEQPCFLNELLASSVEKPQRPRATACNVPTVLA